MLLLLLEKNDDLGLLSSSEKVETLDLGSTQETQKNPKIFPGMSSQ